IALTSRSTYWSEESRLVTTKLLLEPYPLMVARAGPPLSGFLILTNLSPCPVYLTAFGAAGVRVGVCVGVGVGVGVLEAVGVSDVLVFELGVEPALSFFLSPPPPAMPAITRITTTAAAVMNHHRFQMAFLAGGVPLAG